MTLLVDGRSHGWLTRVGRDVYVMCGGGGRLPVTSLRRYRILRLTDNAVLATGETQWAFIDFTTGQPMRVPAEIAQAFQVVAEPPLRECPAENP